MSIALGTMSLEELEALNQEVCALIRKHYAARQSAASRKFHVGDRVSFRSGTAVFAPLITITIDKINEKSVGGKTDEGKRWRVSPTLLTLEHSTEGA